MRREVQVARLLARGRTNSEIARALGLSTATARHYTEHVLAKGDCLEEALTSGLKAGVSQQMEAIKRGNRLDPPVASS